MAGTPAPLTARSAQGCTDTPHGPLLLLVVVADPIQKRFKPRRRQEAREVHCRGIKPRVAFASGSDITRSASAGLGRLLVPMRSTSTGNPCRSTPVNPSAKYRERTTGSVNVSRSRSTDLLARNCRVFSYMAAARSTLFFRARRNLERVSSLAQPCFASAADGARCLTFSFNAARAGDGASLSAIRSDQSQGQNTEGFSTYDTQRERKLDPCDGSAKFRYR